MIALPGCYSFCCKVGTYNGLKTHCFIYVNPCLTNLHVSTLNIQTYTYASNPLKTKQRLHV